MARKASAFPDLEPAEVEVAFVVDDEHCVRLDLEEARRGADRSARVVHVRLGFEQRHLVSVHTDLGELAGELALPRAVVPTRELVHDHPANVVPVVRVLPTGIAEPDDEQVQRRPRVVSAEAKTHAHRPVGSDGHRAKPAVLGGGTASGAVAAPE